MPPIVSVIMPVYNGAIDLPEAVKCILNQTYSDFEFIAIDDGSKDNSAEVLGELARFWNDQRFKVVCLPQNVGLAAALNHGIDLAQGRYVARQDQDDISRPTRLAHQVAYMDANPKCGLLGTRAEIWVGNTPTTRNHDHPAENAVLQFDLMTNNPFVHSSVMLRSAVFRRVGKYSIDPTRQPPEDYEYWSRIARHYDVANIPERLQVYREVSTSMSRAGPNPFQSKLVTIAAENIAHAVGLTAPDRHCMNIAALVHSDYARLVEDVDIDACARVVNMAAERIAAEAPAALAEMLHDRKNNLIHAIQHQYRTYKTGPVAVPPYASLLQHVTIPPRVRKWVRYLRSKA